MELKFFCPLWGSENLDIQLFFAKVKNAGYDGVEMRLPMENERRKKIPESAKNSDLQIISQQWETSAPDYDTHQKEYRQRLLSLALPGRFRSFRQCFTKVPQKKSLIGTLSGSL